MIVYLIGLLNMYLFMNGCVSGGASVPAAKAAAPQQHQQQKQKKPPKDLATQAQEVKIQIGGTCL